MKQIVFSYVDPKVSAIMITYGEMIDGSFKPLEFDGILDTLPPYISRLIHDEPIFQSGYYILPKDFDDFFRSLVPIVDSFVFYPNLLVCNLNSESDGTEEEE